MPLTSMDWWLFYRVKEKCPEAETITETMED